MRSVICISYVMVGVIFVCSVIFFIHVSSVIICHTCLFCDYDCHLYMFCILSFVLCLSLHQVLGVYITWCVHHVVCTAWCLLYSWCEVSGVYCIPLDMASGSSVVDLPVLQHPPVTLVPCRRAGRAGHLLPASAPLQELPRAGPPSQLWCCHH